MEAVHFALVQYGSQHYADDDRHNAATREAAAAAVLGAIKPRVEADLREKIAQWIEGDGTDPELVAMADELREMVL